MGCNCKNKKKEGLVGALPEKVQKMKIFKAGYIKSFLSFLWSNILSGFKQVTHEQYYDRLAICRGCPFLNHEKLRCTDCGCFVKVKAKFKSEDCPQDFWAKLKNWDGDYTPNNIRGIHQGNNFDKPKVIEKETEAAKHLKALADKNIGSDKITIVKPK